MSWYDDLYMGEGLSILFLTGFAIGLLIVIVLYLFRAVALFQISRQRGYQNAWIAFIPVVNGYVLGGVADNVNTCYGKKSSWRVWMLVAQAAGFLATLTNLIVVFTQLGDFFDDLAFSYDASFIIAHYMGKMMAVSALTSLISLGILVVNCFVLYRVYQDYSRNAVLFTVLSVLFHIAPFFLFALRNKPSASLAYRSQFYAPAATAYQPPQNPQYPPQAPQNPQYPPQPPQAPQYPFQNPQNPPQTPQTPQTPQPPQTPPQPPQTPPQD